MQILNQDLRDALNLLQKVLAKRATLPIVQNFLVKDGMLIATDLEVGAMVSLPGLKGENFVIPSAMQKLLKSIPGYEMLDIKTEGGVTVTWSTGKSSIPCKEKAADFPEMPELVDTVSSIVDGDMLVNAMYESLPYAATEDSRPPLTGVSLIPPGEGEEGIHVFAADGFRMAVKDLALKIDLGETRIIPPRAIKLLMDIWTRTPTEARRVDSLIEMITAKRQMAVTTSSSQKVMKFSFGRVTFITRLIEGTVPDYKQIIPSESTSTANFFAQDFAAALRRLGTLVPKSGIIRMKWEDNKLALSAENEDEGTSEETIAANIDQPGFIALNIKYLDEYFSKREGFVTMAITTKSAPAKFQQRGSPVILIMPMFIKDGDKPTEEKSAAESTPTEATTGEETPAENMEEEEVEEGGQEEGEEEEGAEVEG